MRSSEFPGKSSPLGRRSGHRNNSKHNLIASAHLRTADENQSVGQFHSPAPTSGTSQRKTEVPSHAIGQIEKDLRWQDNNRKISPPKPAHRRLSPRQQTILQSVIDAAQRTPGSLRMLNRGGWIYTALHRHGRTGWRIEDTYRQPIADGEC